MDLYQPANVGYQVTDQIKFSEKNEHGAEFKGIPIPIHYPTKVIWPHGFIESTSLPASEATKEEGEQMLEAVSQYFAEFLTEFKKASFPSD
jgi:hypothetical protein